MTLPSHHIPPRPFAGTESTLLDAGPHEPQVQPTTARSIRAVHMPECSLICPPGDSPRPATIYTPAAARPAAWQRALVMPPAPTRSPASARQPASQPACLPALLSPARAERRDMSAAEFEPRPTRQLCPAFRHVFLSSPLLVPNVTRPSCYLRSKLSRFLCRLAKRGATKRARLVSRHRQADTGVLRSADPGRYFLCAAQGTSDGPFLLLRPGRAMARPETTARSRLP